jgi:hypothetical protein
MVNKVYEIIPDGWVQERNDLGRAIAALARQENEAIYYHDYKADPSGEPRVGAPVILLECSAAFLEKVKQLPKIESVRIPTNATERVPRILAYFMAPVIKGPKTSKGPAQ